LEPMASGYIHLDAFLEDSTRFSTLRVEFLPDARSGIGGRGTETATKAEGMVFVSSWWPF